MKVAITQFKMSWNIDDNLAKAEQMVRKAAQKGAQIILQKPNKWCEKPLKKAHRLSSCPNFLKRHISAKGKITNTSI